MIDLYTKCKALKAVWVEKLIKDESLFELFEMGIPIKDQTLWSCNLQYRDFKEIGQNTFGKEILCAWSYINYVDPQNMTQVLDQSLWYNRIRQDKKFLYYPKAGEANIRQIRDIHDTAAHSFYIYKQINVRYPCAFNFVQYHCLIASIPAGWKYLSKK